MVSLLSSGFFSEFTQKMKDLNAVYQAERPIDDKSLYLFVFPDGNTEGGLLGDMPLKSRFGYIFNAADKDITTAQITQTVAHELGHGAFQLKHTFSDKYNIEKFKTKNLMDYPLNEAKAIDNIELVKYQWDCIYDPQNKLFDWMQGEDEGQQVNRPKFIANRRILMNWIKDKMSKQSESIVFRKIDFEFDPLNHNYNESKDAIINGQSIPLEVILNDNGLIDFHDGNSNYFIAISIPGLGQVVDYGNTQGLPKESSNHTSFYLCIHYKDKSVPAIILYTFSYEDFEKLLNELSIDISGQKGKIVDFYNKAINVASNECDKTDVIYETIPDFVSSSLSNYTKWVNFNSMVNCPKSSIGTDEYMAISNILMGIEPEYLYNKIIENKSLFRELVDDVPSSSFEDYITLFCRVGNTKWTDLNLSQAGATYAKSFDSNKSTEEVILNWDEDYLTFNGIYNKDAEVLLISNFKLGRTFSSWKKDWIVYSRMEVLENKSYDFYSPITVYFEDQYQITMPAFLAWEIVERFAPASTEMQVLQFCTNLLLLENTLAKPGWFTRLFKIKKPASIQEVFLFEKSGDVFIFNTFGNKVVIPDIRGHYYNGNCGNVSWSVTRKMGGVKEVKFTNQELLSKLDIEYSAGKLFKGNPKYSSNQAFKPTELNEYLTNTIENNSFGIIWINRGPNDYGHFLNFYKCDGKVFYLDYTHYGNELRTLSQLKQSGNNFFIMDLTSKAKNLSSLINKAPKPR